MEQKVGCPVSWYVYLLEGCPARPGGVKTYIGVTTDIGRRVRQHNGELAGGARSTRSGRPWTLVRLLECRGVGVGVTQLAIKRQALRLERWWKGGFRGVGRKRAGVVEAVEGGVVLLEVGVEVLEVGKV